MSAEAQGLQIPVSFTLDEARAALRVLQEEARKAGRAIGAELDGGGGVGGGGGKGGLSGLKENLSRSREAAMFFTASLGEFGPAGRTAQFAISGLVGALAGGGGLILLLEGARIAIRLFTERTREQEEAQKKAAEAAKKHAEAMADLERATWRANLQARGFRAEQIDAMEKLGPIDAQLADLGKRYATLTSQIDELRSVEARWREAAKEDVLGQGPWAMRAGTAKREADRLTKERNDLQADITRLQQERAGYAGRFQSAVAVAEAEARQAAREKEREDEKRHLAEQAAMRSKAEHDEIDASLAAEAEYYSERAKRQLERDARYEEYAKEHQRRLTEIENAEFERRLEEAERSTRRMTELAKASLQSLGQSLVSEFGRGLRVSRAYTQAMREAGATTQAASDLSAAAIAAMVQDTLASFAEQSAVEALMETARGFAALARYDGGAASRHFTSAAMFAAAAAAAGVAAHVIGQNRGMTSSERASVEAAREQNAARESGPRELGASPERGGGNTYNVFFSGRALVSEPEVKRFLADLMKETRESGW